MSKSLVIALAGGGTGGHVYPGLALAASLRALDPSVSLVWFGTPGRMEERVVPAHGIPLVLLDVAFLKGRRGVALLSAAARLGPSALQAVRALRKHGVQAVVGLGGFVSGPVCAAARLLGIPVFLLEQNARTGLTNRAVSRLATRVYASFPDTFPWLPASRVRVWGNPIRGALLAAKQVSQQELQGPLRILIVGGSQGARSLNERLPAVLDTLWTAGASLSIRHIAGSGNEEKVAHIWESLGRIVQVDAYVEDMAAAYAGADLVIARAGATTIAELTCLGLPAVYIPFPFAADDHQTANAASVVAAGGGWCIADAKIESDEAFATLRLALQPAALRRAGVAAASLGRPDAGRQIARDILHVLDGAMGRSRFSDPPPET